MLIYCPKCQNLVDKVYEDKKEGDTAVRKCQRCGISLKVYIKYKAVARERE